MSKSSFSVAEILSPGETYFSTELPTNAITGHPYLEHVAAVAIFNGKGSGVKLRVRRCNTRPLSGRQAPMSFMNFRKISAASGANGAGYVTPNKFDSVNADLPAQVQFIPTPETWTTSTGIWRRNMFIPLANMTRALANLCAMMPNGGASGGFANGEVVKLVGDADIQKMVLREGEGIWCFHTSGSTAAKVMVNVTLRNQATGETYMFSHSPRTVLDGITGNSFSLMNNTGSGVVLEILRIRVNEMGTDEPAIIAYEPIDGIDSRALDANFMLANSTDSLPAEVFVKQNVIVRRAGAKFGAIITSPAMRRLTLSEPPYEPNRSSGPYITRRSMFCTDMEQQGDSEIVLNEGQGIAVFVKTPSALYYHEFGAVVTIETPDVVSSGPTCFAF